jgi:hypothetical protein
LLASAAELTVAGFASIQFVPCVTDALPLPDSAPKTRISPLSETLAINCQ